MKFLSLQMYRKDDRIYLQLVETGYFMSSGMSPALLRFLGVLTLPEILQDKFHYDPSKNEFPIQVDKPVVFLATDDSRKDKTKQEHYLSTAMTLEVTKNIRTMNDLFGAIAEYTKTRRFDYYHFSPISVIDALQYVDGMTVMQQCELFPDYQEARQPSFNWAVRDANVAEADQARVLPGNLTAHLTQYAEKGKSAPDIFAKLFNDFLTLTNDDPDFQKVREALADSNSYASSHHMDLIDCMSPYAQLRVSTKIDSILLNPSTPKEEKLRYLQELQTQLTGKNYPYSFKEVLGWIFDETMNKIYQKCMEQVDPDETKYGLTHSEYRFLMAAKFVLQDDGRLSINMQDNPVFINEYNTNDKVKRLKLELQHMAKWLDFEFDQDADFGGKVTFTNACSERLIALGLHLNSDYFFEQKRRRSMALQQPPV